MKQEKIWNPGLQEKWPDFSEPTLSNIISLLGQWRPAELKTNMICSAPTASELVLWNWNWQEECLTIKAGTWKCKCNCLKDIRAAVLLIWSMYRCTVILPTHHNHNFSREPESIVMEISNDKFKDQLSILVSCLDMRKIWLLQLLWCK